MAFPFFRPSSSRPGQVQKPILNKPVSKPKPVAKPGFFGEKKYRSFLELRELARKAPYKSIPTYSTKLGKQQRVDVVKKMAEYGRKYLNKTYGLSATDYDYIIKKAEKERGLAAIKHDYKKREELDKFVKQAQQWKKG